MNWEYLVESTEYLRSPRGKSYSECIELMLNKAGKDGWELVGHFPCENECDAFTFKRPRG